MDQYKFKGKGQINIDSTFGNLLYKIASLESVKNIFEVGSWNGEGSTCCLMNGIYKKANNSMLYSLEANEEMYNQSKLFWNNKDNKNKLVLLNGTLHNKIVDLNILNILYNNNIPYYKEHYIPESDLVKSSNLINIDNILNLDFIILDGGEYTTQFDYDVLILKNPKYIALDDTNIYKCKNIRKQLLDSNDWELYEENQNDRNGWSIFQKKY